MNQFKRAKVVMLSTQKAENCLYKNINTNKLNYHKGYLTQEYLKNSINSESFNLYIISNDEIKECDWCLLDHNVGESSGYSVLQCLNADIKNGEYTFKDKEGDLFTTGRCSKIIATTDISLTFGEELFSTIEDWENKIGFKQTLPQPSYQFIEKYIESYNKGNIITDVLVEYEGYECVNGHFMSYQTTCTYPHCEQYNYPKLKVDKNNNITIKKIKDNWNREETVTLVLKMQHDYVKHKEEAYFTPNLREIADWTNTWIENNI